MATQTDLQQVWFVISPQNPLKPKHTLLRDYDRLHLVQLAIGDNPNLRASDVEFSLPKPSYTIDTLTVLKEKYPHHEFTLIMGGDNLGTLHQWKNYALLLKNYQIYVYDRPGSHKGELATHARVRLYDQVPMMEISATYIRNCIKTGKSIQYLVPDAVYQYLLNTNLYRG